MSHAADSKMMGSASFFLLAQLMFSVMGEHGEARMCYNKSSNAADVFKRLSREEEEARADKLFPGWRTCCVSPWEMSNAFEGDIRVESRKQLRMALRDPTKKWPSTEIPYLINKNYFYKEEIKEIQAAIKSFNRFTCVKFREVTENDNDYVLIVGKYEGCSTAIGRQGGEQLLNLEPLVCLHKRGSIYHQLMHALGITHEHNSPLRDDYIRILTANVQDDKLSYFEKLLPSEATDYGYDYDLNSIMHAGRKAYSKNNRSTVETIDEFASIGHKQKLSETDVLKVNRHFDCIKYNN